MSETTLRAVLDTNLIVSYLLTQGDTLSRIIDHWEQADFVVVISPEMIEELSDVLKRPRLQRYMTADPQALLEIIQNDAEHTAGEIQLSGICRDPKDDMFIACAVEGNAGIIVSGDSDLLDLREYRGIKIMRPVQFVELLDAM